MRSLVTPMLCAALAACAALPPTAAPPAHLFQDQRFGAPSMRSGADDVFALSDSMRLYLRTALASELRNRDRRRALIDALYSKAQLKLEYDAALTRNAAEAFDARAGNCLSLVIMTAAFAKELGLQVRYQSAYLEETWSRSSNLLLRSGHVNVTLGPRLVDIHTSQQLSPWTIDFLPADQIRGLRTREIAEDTVVAMYLNNRAAETLVQGQIDDAYAWARAAAQRDPGFLAAYNTLGVIYLRHGDPAQAAAVFGYVLERDAKNTPALSNLASALTRLGRVDEAEAVRRRLAQLEPEPPFHFFYLGLAAMKRGDFAAARAHFAKEVARADDNPEFHFWLGVASFRLGDLDAARKHLTLALNQSTSRGERELYAAKLSRLRTNGAQ